MLENRKFGPIVRALVLGGLALFCLSRLAEVLGEEAARVPESHMVNGVDVVIPLEPRPPAFFAGVWGSAIGVALACGLIAFGSLRELRVPAGTRVFPRLAVTGFAEVVMSGAGGFLLIGLAMLPRMVADAYGQFGLRTSDVVSLSVLAAFGALLLLWRPVFLLKRGAPVVRCPIGFWFPWRQTLKGDVRLVWESFFAGQSPRVQVGWMLRAKIGKQQFDVEYVGLDLPDGEREQVRAEWGGALRAA
jgi:hypothetical protein